MATTIEAQLTFDGNEMERYDARNGSPYIRFANVTIETKYEIVERTVMAFGDMIPVAQKLAFPGRKIPLLVEDRGRTFVVVGNAA